MTHRKPPRLATWLLERLGFTRRNPALTGDLLEEFHNGRSRAWYWRQTAVVIAKGFRRQAFSGTLLSFGSIAFAALALLDYVLWRLHFHRDDSWTVTAIMTLVTICIFTMKRWWPAKRGEGVATTILLLINCSLIAWTGSASLPVRIARDFALTVVAWLAATIGALRARRSGRKE